MASMIQQTEVSGRPALVVYIDEDWNPVASEADATVIKVTFTDREGGTVFLQAGGEEGASANKEAS